MLSSRAAVFLLEVVLTNLRKYFYRIELQCKFKRGDTDDSNREITLKALSLFYEWPESAFISIPANCNRKK